MVLQTFFNVLKYTNFIIFHRWILIFFQQVLHHLTHTRTGSFFFLPVYRPIFAQHFRKFSGQVNQFIILIEVLYVFRLCQSIVKSQFFLRQAQLFTIAMATIKNFDRKGGFKLDGYKEIIPSSKLKESQHAELFDTLVAHTDLTQNAEVIGNAEPVMSKSGYDDIIFSMDLVKVLPKKENVSKFLLAAILQDKKFKAHCLGYVNGTTVLHLSKKALPEYKLFLPSDLSKLRPILCRTPQELYTALANDLETEIQISLGID